PCQPIAVRNVLGYLTGVLEHPETAARVFDIGGPEVLTYLQIMHIMAEELHLRRRVIIPVPVLTPLLSSYWIHLVTPLSKDIARPLAEGLKNPVVAREDSITEIIPQELLTVRQAIKAARSKTADGQVETSWSMAGPIEGDPHWAGGTVFQDVREVQINAPPHAVFQAVSLLGGDHGWYSAKYLWTIRGWMDRLVGGPGIRRGRLHPDRLGYGEALDFWRVVGIERDKSLVLRAEMKLPGVAVLEFCIEPCGSAACKLKQNAKFQPKGLLGILYWYSVLPFHHFVFRGMLEGIKTQAEKFAKGDERPTPHEVPEPSL
ncbi:MAG TPA: SDR family oxidoreductase, partial [Candidatus Eremiobacteraceae bacterium]|nr:SDR family oxidoreductase [Candidatus Eremiobacteraceae bacterium]